MIYRNSDLLFEDRTAISFISNNERTFDEAPVLAFFSELARLCSFPDSRSSATLRISRVWCDIILQRKKKFSDDILAPT